ncbi:MAG: hypothetical protein ABS81_01080 [Pseudonocardia sp. SCN 72-86]|nr:MAG: hypothetical protein ABS81_01080 [Pseudonocardia sp. SCN 72-86]
MSDARLFLSFTSLTDSSKHTAYNEWHQLDHLPENLALPGVAWGDRWVRSPDCAAVAHVPDPAYRHHEYAVAYWFREPVDDAVAQWTALNQRALWWGRRPELAWTRREPVGFFDPVSSHAVERVLVGPAAIRYRPHRGVHLTLSRVAGPGEPAMVEHMRRIRRELLPAVLDVPGVAGASIYRFAAPAAGFGSETAEADDGLLLRVLHLDDDPVATTRLLTQRCPDWIRGSATEDVLSSSPFRTISPWEWDWFSNGAEAPPEAGAPR